jgi:hypothetical protein
VLDWAKADTPNALPKSNAGRPKVFPDFIMVFALLSFNNAPVFQTSTRNPYSRFDAKSKYRGNLLKIRGLSDIFPYRPVGV